MNMLACLPTNPMNTIPGSPLMVQWTWTDKQTIMMKNLVKKCTMRATNLSRGSGNFLHIGIIFDLYKY